jgi:hypothetical protein
MEVSAPVLRAASVEQIEIKHGNGVANIACLANVSKIAACAAYHIFRLAPLVPAVRWLKGQQTRITARYHFKQELLKVSTAG